MYSLEQTRGDSVTHRIPLLRGRLSFSPGGHTLIATFKRLFTDSDANAVFQKVSGTGIDVDGTTALVSIAPVDTATLEDTKLLYDIQAQNLDTGEVFTVADGALLLRPDVTRLTTVSKPIHTEQPGAAERAGEYADAAEGFSLEAKDARDATLSAKDTAVAAAAQTTEDRTQTGIDRTATELALGDANAAAQAAIAAAQLTAQDKTATSADRTQTGNDLSAVQTAKQTVLEAQTDVTSKANTVTSQLAVVNQKAIEAADSASAALTSKNAAKTSENNAKTSETNSAASAGTATAKAAESLLSAEQALGYMNAANSFKAACEAIAGYTRFVGAQAGVSVPATSAYSGDAYLISSIGVSQGKTWDVGDLAIYNGNSGSWSQIPKTIWMGLQQNSVNAIGPKPYFISDGSTPDRGITVPMGAQNLAGQTVTLKFEGYVPTVDPSSRAFMFRLASVRTESVPFDYSLVCFWETNGSFYVVQRGSGVAGENYRAVVSPSLRASYAGQFIKVVLVLFGDSAMNPVLIINGKDISSSWSPNNSGAAPNWMPPTLAGSFFSTAYNMTAGKFVMHSPIIGAWTLAEAQHWMQTGQDPDWCQVATGTVRKYVSDFSAGADSWYSYSASGTITGNVDGILSEDNVLSYFPNSTYGSHSISRDFSLPIGKYRIRAKIYLPASNVNAQGAQFYVGGDGPTSATWKVISGSRIYEKGSVWTNVDLVIELYKNYGSINFYQYLQNGTLAFAGTGAATDDLLYIKDVVIDVLGPVFKPVIGPGFIVGDLGANALCGRLAPGIIPSTPLTEYIIRGKTSTASNQQLLGGTVTSVGDALMRVWARVSKVNASGTPSVTVGNVSGGSQLVASVALSTAWKQLTIVAGAEIATTQNVWVNSSTTDEIEWKLFYEYNQPR